jgi:glyoxylase-like metal-dependent hydrolase (beta-lactamase superfamily II)
VIATAGWSSAATWSNSCPIFDAPSSIEYSVCTWRWTKPSPSPDPATGLVLVDTGGAMTESASHAALREHTDAEVHSVVLTHGHVDHIAGLRRYDEEGIDGAPPRVIAHEAIEGRFDRYARTAGHNGIINSRQFGIDVRWPTRYRRPDETYRSSREVEVGGERLVLRHARGETDDHTWVHLPDRRVMCCGDLFIWASPNAGNPQKVQRYPDEWAAALRDMAALDAEVLLPGHGVPVLGTDRVRQALEETAAYLESLCEQVLERMNAGQRLDEIVHAVRAARRARPASVPAPHLRPVRLRRTQPVAAVGRLVGRQPRPPRACAGSECSRPSSPTLAGGARSACTIVQRRWPNDGELAARVPARRARRARPRPTTRRCTRSVPRCSSDAPPPRPPRWPPGCTGGQLAPRGRRSTTDETRAHAVRTSGSARFGGRARLPTSCEYCSDRSLAWAPLCPMPDGNATMRRILAGATALAVGLVLLPAATGQVEVVAVPVTVAEQLEIDLPSPVRAQGVEPPAPVVGEVIAAPITFTMVGFELPDGVDELRVRTSADGETWSDWTATERFDAEDRPDAGSDEAAGDRSHLHAEPVWVEEATHLQVELPAEHAGSAASLRAELIDSAGLSGGEVERRVVATSASADASNRPDVISRAEWGADESLARPTSRASEVHMGVVHHTATSNDYTDARAVMRAMYRYHTQNLNWADLGYNIVVDQQGNVYEGRAGGLENKVIGAHAYGYNTGSFGVSVIGNFDHIRPPRAALDAVADVIAWQSRVYEIDPQGWTNGMNGSWHRTLLGHRDVGSTACPGQHFYPRLGEVREQRRQAGRRLARRMVRRPEARAAGDDASPPDPAARRPSGRRP